MLTGFDLPTSPPAESSLPAPPPAKGKGEAVDAREGHGALARLLWTSESRPCRIPPDTTAKRKPSLIAAHPPYQIYGAMEEGGRGGGRATQPPSHHGARPTHCRGAAPAVEALEPTAGARGASRLGARARCWSPAVERWKEREREVTRREREVRGGRRGDSVVESEGGRLRL